MIAYLAKAENDWLGEQDADADDAYRIARELTRHEKDLLIAAIASNLLEQESPWLQGACKMLEIEQAHK